MDLSKALPDWIEERRARLVDAWLRVMASLWFRPMAWLAVLSLTALVLVFLEWNYLDRDGLWDKWFVLWQSQAEGARTMLGAIAGATLTVVSLAFSLMMIVVIQAANAYSPRLISQFIADRRNHHVLGLLLGHFAYSILVLRVIRQDPSFVPHISVNLALLLSILSIVALVAFIQNVAQSIQVPNIIDMIEQQTEEIIEQDALMDIGRPHQGDFQLHDGRQIEAEHSGYVRLLGAPMLEKIVLFEGDAVVELHYGLGDYVQRGARIATVWNAEGSEELVKRARDCIHEATVFGKDRSWEQDIDYGLSQLTDIALRALSPGINDPSTAIMAINSLTKMCMSRYRQRRYLRHRANTEGALKLIFVEDDLGAVLLRTYVQVFSYGKEDLMVVLKLLEGLSHLGDVTPPGERGALYRCAEEFLEEARAQSWTPQQRRALEASGRGALTRLQRAAHPERVVESPSDLEVA